MKAQSASKEFFSGLLLAMLLITPAYSAHGSASQSEARTARHFQAVKQQAPLLWAFLKEMPKGGDLHNHLSGAIYAESMINWAAEDGLCVDKRTFSLSAPPCDEVRANVVTVLRDAQLYRQVVDAWSMRNQAISGQSGHDHFFDTFDKFDLAGERRVGEMLAEVSSRAAAGRVNYLELMLTPAFPEIVRAAPVAGWHNDLAAMRQAIKQPGFAEAVRKAADTLTLAETKRREIQRCETPAADPGCAVTVRYQYQVLRGLPAEIVFAQMLLGFELASIDPRVVGLNLVMPEDAFVPMRDFSLHMRMLDYLHQSYPWVHIALHAGELTPGLVPPEGLRFHIRDSIVIGHAQRIGHGVAVMQEDDAMALLRKMAHDKVMVEICLTSNEGILGVQGARHPLSVYLKQGVPVALATDDEGVSRSEMTHEYLKAVQEQNVDYRQLKAMARNSLQYSFVEGASLWKDFERRRRVRECSGDSLNANCQGYLARHTRARLQWALEEAFTKFERKY